MSEARRRPGSISNSAPHSLDSSNRNNGRSNGSRVRSISSGSVTPLQDEEEDDTPRRSTRAKNPLPPTTGPLFPPLPPKQPKASPKTSPRPPVNGTPRSNFIPSSSSLSALADADPPDADVKPDTTTSSTLEQEEAEEKGMDMEVDLPSLSNASLTPPPPSEGMDLAPEAEAEVESGIAEESREEVDNWQQYRRHRGIRGLGGAKKVKVEPQEVEVEPTPDIEIDSLAPPAVITEGSTPTSAEDREHAELTARQTRKRRGEGQLLMDDHLLPKEMKETGQVTGKRGREGVVVVPEPRTRIQAPLAAEPEVEEKEQMVEEEGEEEAEVADEGDVISADMEAEEEEEVEDEKDEGDSDDITRCVCKLSGDEIDSMFIQCDTCNVWQHGGCVGIWADEEAPDNYYCEECKPELHVALRKYIRRRHGGVYVPPSPADLQQCHPANDRHPPSQSKRWKDWDPKPIPRSHHRKPTPELAPDAKRSRRIPGRHEKSTSVVEPTKESSRKPISSNRKVSITRLSISPTRSSSSPQPHAPPKRRSTMNSRDAAYEEQVKAALEASKREMQSPQAETDKRKEVNEEEVEVEIVKKKKKEKAKEVDKHREREDDDMESGPSKPKHPNQYTYRPKLPIVQAIASPIRRPAAASTPIPTLPPATHEHGTRRAAVIATTPQVFSNSIHDLRWLIPEHLSAFTDLFETETPIPIEVRSPRVLQSLPKNHYSNQKYGPFTEDRDGDDKLILPGDISPRETIGEPSTHLEPPTRVRYPIKRITVTEMKKRVRQMLDYTSRVGTEERKRQERANKLGIDPNPLPRPAKVHIEDGDSSMEIDKPEEVLEDLPNSSQLVEEIIRDLVAFQETFQVPLGGGYTGNGGFASPLPPSMPIFGGGLSVPPTPIFKVDSQVEAGLEIDNEVNGEGEVEMEVDGGEAPVQEDGDGEVRAQEGGPDVVEENGEEKEETEMVLPAEGGELVMVEQGPDIEVYREGMVDKIGVEGTLVEV